LLAVLAFLDHDLRRFCWNKSSAAPAFSQPSSLLLLFQAAVCVYFFFSLLDWKEKPTSSARGTPFPAAFAFAFALTEGPPSHRHRRRIAEGICVLQRREANAANCDGQKMGTTAMEKKQEPPAGFPGNALLATLLSSASRAFPSRHPLLLLFQPGVSLFVSSCCSWTGTKSQRKCEEFPHSMVNRDEVVMINRFCCG
jgi:hypothetical protein